MNPFNSLFPKTNLSVNKSAPYLSQLKATQVLMLRQCFQQTVYPALFCAGIFIVMEYNQYDLPFKTFVIVPRQMLY